MKASELKSLAVNRQTPPNEVSVEVMTVLKNVANEGKLKASFRELSSKDQEALRRLGYSVRCVSDYIDLPYVVDWSQPIEYLQTFTSIKE